MRIRVLLLFFALCFLLNNANAFNFLVVCSTFAYSHIKFMNRVADILADGGHNVILLQTYSVEHWGRRIRLAKNKNVTIIDYHLNEKENIDEKKTESAQKYLWNDESVNGVSGAMSPMFVLYEEFSPMCEKIYRDRKLHEMILDMDLDGYVAEAFDFCSLYLGDHLKLNLLPMFSSVKSIPASRAIGEPSLLNYAPTLYTKYGADQTFWDRLNDIPMVTAFYYAFSALFERQFIQADQFFKKDVRHWREILQTSTFFFYNNNPYIGFPMPTLEKSVEIGGFTIDSSVIEKVDEEYDRILNLRGSTVLISFGTVVLSMDMPEKMKYGIVGAVAALPDTTFIWKYENADDVSFEIPENLIMKKWIPQTALLADKRLTLFITHGGLGSTLELAYSGKPSIVIPVFGDQLFNAKMLSRHGGAKTYNKYDLENARLFRKTIEDSIESRFMRSSAQRLSEMLQNQPFDPKMNLLRHAEFSAKFGRVEALEPYHVNYNIIQFYMLDAYFLYIMIFLAIVYIYFVSARFVYNTFVNFVRRRIKSSEKLE